MNQLEMCQSMCKLVMSDKRACQARINFIQCSCSLRINLSLMHRTWLIVQACPSSSSDRSLCPPHLFLQALLLALCLWPCMPSDLLPASPLPKGCAAPPSAWVRTPGAVPWVQVAGAAGGLFSSSYLSQVRDAL